MPTDRKKHHRLIQPYGLFWDRDEVGWLDRGAKLLGVARAGKPVDFRSQVGIYALYDQEFRLLYVGQAGGGQNTSFDRLKIHNTLRAGTRAMASRWRYFSWFGVLRVLKGKNELASRPETRLTKAADILDALEAVVIEITGPDLNRQGGRVGDATEYLQCTPDRISAAHDR